MGIRSSEKIVEIDTEISRATAYWYVSRGILCSFLLDVPFAQAYIYSNVRDWQGTGLWRSDDVLQVTIWFL